jgi:hypothetical protein
MSTADLERPISEGIRSTNFFNGRLLSAEDLIAEQTAQRQLRQLLGQSVGEGVVYGLEVSETPGSPPLGGPVVTIEAGLAVNRKGHTLALAQRTDLRLVRPPAGAAGAASGFAECQPLQPGVYVTGEGVYLLVISPASRSEGRAPASGLGNVTAACTTRSTVNTVQFRLIALAGADTTNSAKARNRIAYQCLGAVMPPPFPADPFGSPSPRYGLLDDLRPGTLTDCDLPLGVLHWTVTGGLRFVDNWSVRRRLTSPSSHGRWAALLGDRRRREIEAMILQFEEHIESIRLRESNLGAIHAVDRFDFLPPVGMVPVSGSGSPSGFNTAAFFGSHASQDVATLDGQVLPSLWHDALSHEPVDLRQPGKVQLYSVFENLNAVQQGQSRQRVVVFASSQLSYRGVARFGFARWGRSRFAPRVI